MNFSFYKIDHNTPQHKNRTTEQEQQQPGEPQRTQICAPEERSAAPSNQFRAKAVQTKNWHHKGTGL